MMQKVVIATYCDCCYQADQTKIETSFTVEVGIGVDQARPDLCPRVPSPRPTA
ncbi:hypothetical protein ACQP1W_43660 [Spirillospora sp. CA-255316]